MFSSFAGNPQMPSASSSICITNHRHACYVEGCVNACLSKVSYQPGPAVCVLFGCAFNVPIYSGVEGPQPQMHSVCGICGYIIVSAILFRVFIGPSFANKDVLTGSDACLGGLVVLAGRRLPAQPSQRRLNMTVFCTQPDECYQMTCLG